MGGLGAGGQGGLRAASPALADVRATLFHSPNRALDATGAIG